MVGYRKILVSLSIAWLTVVQTPGLARAEEPAVIKAMLDGYALNLQSRPTYQAIESGSDGTITLKGFSFTFPQGLDIQYDIETVTLRGVTEVAGKGFEVAGADYAGMTLKFGGEMVAAVPAIAMSGLYVRAVPENPTAFEKTLASSTLARETTIPEAVILIADKSLKIENVHMTFEGDAWGYNGTQRMTMGRLAVPEDIMALAGDEVPLKQLGYTALEFSSDSTLQFSFTPEAMSFGLDLGLSGKDMGTVRLAGNFANIPFALVEEAQKNQDGEDPTKLLEIANGISISGLSLGFADATLTNRVIDFLAAAQQMDRAQLIATAAATVQLALTDLKNQDFTNKVIAAVNSFLAAPGSIRLLAAAAPVKVEQIVNAGEDPAALMDLLHVDVQANQ